MTSLPHFASRILRPFVVATLVLVLARCDSDPLVPVPPDEHTFVGSKLSTLAVAVALAPEGRGPFDNFLACPRRGIVDYRNTAAGRSVTISGCDLGDSVTVNGAAEVAWVGPALSPTRERVTRLKVVGNLDVRITGGPILQVEELELEGISFDGVAFPTITDLVLDSMRATLLGRTVRVSEVADPERVFRPRNLTINTIPNPSGSLSTLTTVDLRRVAFHPSILFASVLLNELLEVQRGEHTHELDCGTLHVVPDLTTLTTQLRYNLDKCELDPGLIVSGSFVQDWTGDFAAGRFGMLLQGEIVMGGGFPRITLNRLEWEMSGFSTTPAPVTITGVLQNGPESRPFGYQIVLDD